jgi:hypothetical protein
MADNFMFYFDKRGVAFPPRHFAWIIFLLGKELTWIVG